MSPEGSAHSGPKHTQHKADHSYGCDSRAPSGCHQPWVSPRVAAEEPAPSAAPGRTRSAQTRGRWGEATAPACPSVTELQARPGEMASDTRKLLLLGGDRVEPTGPRFVGLTAWFPRWPSRSGCPNQRD